MAYEYDEKDIGGGERWLILNDRKTDDPEELIILDVEERQKKSGDGTLPVLILRDDNGKKFCCSAFPRQVEDIINQWGVKTENWVNQRIKLQPKGKGMVMIPLDNTHTETVIAQ